MPDSYFVYAISSLSQNYIYIGITDNLERRINQHQSGYNRSTKPFRPFKLIYFEITSDRCQARAREKYFKTGVGRAELRQLNS